MTDQDFGDLLRRHRLRVGLTQDQLAERSGISVRTIAGLEAASGRTPRLSSAQRLADALTLSADDREHLIAAVQGPAADRSAPPQRVLSRRFLPYDIPDFTGRDDELGRFLESVGQADDGVVIATIGGMAGVGKTTLAVRAAHAVAERFPDGQFFMDLHGFTPGHEPIDPADALRRLLGAAGVPEDAIPADSEDRAAVWRATLAGRRTLIVLDNARDVAQVQPLLPGAAHALVLITSRIRLTGLDGAATVLSLDVLDPDEALALFARIAGPERVAAEPAACRDVVESCGRLPLAIRIAATRLVHRPTWNTAYLAELLREESERLAELSDGDGDRGVAAAFQMSYAQLSAQHKAMFRLLGLLPSRDFDAFAAAALGDLPLRETGRLLEDLADHHLVIPTAPGRYRFHDLIRHHARSVALAGETEQDRRSAMLRLLDHLSYTAWVAVDLLWPEDSKRRPLISDPGTPAVPLAAQDDARAWLESETSNLVAAVCEGLDDGAPHHAMAMSRLLARYLDAVGRYNEALALHRKATQAAGRVGDIASQARATSMLGTTLSRLGQYEQAVETLLQSVDFYVEAGDQDGELRARNNLGVTYQDNGRYGDALDQLRHILTVAHEIESQAIIVAALNNIGEVYNRIGDYAESITTLTEALQAARAAGSLTSEARAVHQLGVAHDGLGRHRDALEFQERALAMAREAGDVRLTGHSLTALGVVLRHLDRLPESAEAHRQAIAIAREICAHGLEVEALNGLGETLRPTDPTETVACHQKALTIATRLGDRAGAARAHAGLGSALWDLRRAAEAGEHLEQALVRYEALGVPESAAVRDLLADVGTPGC